MPWLFTYQQNVAHLRRLLPECIGNENPRNGNLGMASGAILSKGHISGCEMVGSVHSADLCLGEPDRRRQPHLFGPFALRPLPIEHHRYHSRPGNGKIGISSVDHANKWV